MQYVGRCFLATALIVHTVEQANETWLAEFEAQISTPWDFTAVHINKNSLSGAKKDIV